MPLMTNAEAFFYTFGFYATELWAMTGPQFLEWLTANCDRERPMDAVPVVKCKDCLVKQICRYKTGLGDNGFCSQGEREDDGT